MTELDQVALEHARSTLLAHLNDEIRRQEQVFPQSSGRPGPVVTQADLADWEVYPYEEWFIFTPLGDANGKPIYLVSEGVVYHLVPPWQSYEEALESARALRTGR